jgi:hypothetical protein
MHDSDKISISLPKNLPNMSSTPLLLNEKLPSLGKVTAGQLLYLT